MTTPQEQAAGIQTTNLDLLPLAKLQAIFETFVKTANDDLQTLETALSQADHEQAANSAHRLRGGAHAIGAQALASAAKETETSILEGHQPDLTPIRETLAETLTAIDAYKARRSPDR